MDDLAPLSRTDRQLIMEQLRQSSGSSLSWAEVMKQAKLNMMEKRNIVDAEDGVHLAQLYRRLMSDVPVLNAQDLLQRLEDTTMRSRLRFLKAPATSNCFITSELFFIEVVLLADEGKAEKVLVTHGETSSAKESVALRDIINNKQWNLLEQHLKGLSEAYIHTPDREAKRSAFAFLQEMELYLQNECGTNATGLDVAYYLTTARFGYFIRRDAGTPGRLFFFCSPSTLLSTSADSLDNVTLFDAVQLKGCRRANLLMRSSEETNLLEIECQGSAGYKCLQSKAVFVLAFQDALVVRPDDVDRLLEITGLSADLGQRGNFLQLLLGLDQAPVEKLSSQVVLTDQIHMYSIGPNCCQLEGVELKSISWRSSRQLAELLDVLRRAVMFGHSLGTCIRNIMSNDAVAQDQWRCVHLSFTNCYTFINCLLQHPNVAGFFTVKFFVHPQHRVQFSCPVSPDRDAELSSIGTKVFAKFWSIPITLRAILMALRANGTSAESHDDDQMLVDPFLLKQKPSSPVTHDYREPSVLPSSNNMIEAYGVMNGSGEKHTITFERLEARAEALLEMAMPKVASASLPNMLNLFKEVVVWKELIPPRPIARKMLKSRTPSRLTAAVPLVNADAMGVVTATAAPPTCPIVSAPGGQVAPAASGVPGGQYAKHRHFSSTSETLTELDELCQLSSSFTSGRGPMEVNPADVALFGDQAQSGQNELNIKDTINSVLGSVSSSSAYMNAPGLKTADDTSSSLTSIRNLELSIFGRHYVDAGMMDKERREQEAARNRWAQEMSGGWKVDASGYQSMSTDQCGAIKPDWSDVQRSMDMTSARGMLAVRGMRRRRSRKLMGNTSDRTMEMVLKELRKAERMARGALSRRPRKPRRSANVTIRSEAPVLAESSKFTLKIKPSSSSSQIPVLSAPSPITGSSCQTSGERASEPPRMEAMVSPDAVPGGSLKISNDDILRKQLKAVAREVISVAHLAPLEGDDYDCSAGYPSSDSSSTPDNNNSACLDSKAMGLMAAKSYKRKNSLDAVIGKLMHKANPERRMEGEDFGEEEFDIAFKKHRSFASVGSDGSFMEHQPSSDVAENTSGEGIKLVIKKSALKLTSKQSSASCKGKSPAKLTRSPRGTHRAQSVSPPLLRTSDYAEPNIVRPSSSSKFELLKQKMQSRKLKKQPVRNIGDIESKSRKRPMAERSPSESGDKPQQMVKLSPSQLPSVFPGAEGILFSRSLKGFKIPKIEDNTSKPTVAKTSASTTTATVTKSMTTAEGSSKAQSSEDFSQSTVKHSHKKPFGAFVRHPTPRNILKSYGHPGHTMALGGVPRYRHHQPGMSDGGQMSHAPRYVRRTLLPNPPRPPSSAISSHLHYGSSPSVMQQQRDHPSTERSSSSSAVSEPFPVSASPATAASVTATISSSSSHIIASPETVGLVIDDNPNESCLVRSGSATGAAVTTVTDDSDVLSPGLQIAIEDCSDAVSTDGQKETDVT